MVPTWPSIQQLVRLSNSPLWTYAPLLSALATQSISTVHVELHCRSTVATGTAGHRQDAVCMLRAGGTCRRSQWDSMSEAEAAPEDLRLMSSTKPKLACTHALGLGGQRLVHPAAGHAARAAKVCYQYAYFGWHCTAVSAFSGPGLNIQGAAATSSRHHHNVAERHELHACTAGIKGLL